MYNDNKYFHYTSSCITETNISLYVFLYNENILLYVCLYNRNKYFYYTSSCITEINISVIRLLV